MPYTEGGLPISDEFDRELQREREQNEADDRQRSRMDTAQAEIRRLRSELVEACKQCDELLAACGLMKETDGKGRWVVVNRRSEVVFEASYLGERGEFQCSEWIADKRRSAIAAAEPK